ncbi:MAG TPA: hypothetical protein VE130_11840 [Nitrososphaeraceae archaeon]|nr:hypothetical protein [Nitrososphaeraceae archaeon]
MEITGKPLELLTDHGSQFYANFGEIKSVGISKFQQYLVNRKINHILGRVQHPQTNGKIERFYETFQSKVEHFNSIQEFVIWYVVHSLRLRIVLSILCCKWSNLLLQNEQQYVISSSSSSKSSSVNIWITGSSEALSYLSR